MKHKLELVYFKMRALAEAPRLLFHYTNIEYEDLMSWDYYHKEWSEVKPNIPFKQLPMLVIDKKHEICQSMAIMTFIENLAGININFSVNSLDISREYPGKIVDLFWTHSGNFSENCENCSAQVLPCGTVVS